MNASEPKPRHSTQKAKTSIIKKFNWLYEDWMQDWPLEISDQIDLTFCIQEYPKLVDEDEKFLFMQGMLYALNELDNEDVEQYQHKILIFLKEDFDLHQFTIYYWTLYETDCISEFKITQLMRHLWNFK